ncbi:MAG: ABC transporter permease, partial [Chloroflexi bacterium]
MMTLAQAYQRARARWQARPPEERTLWRDARNRFFKNRLATFGLSIVSLFAIFAVFAEILAPTAYDHSVLTEALQFPSLRHWLGTDQVGRDLLSRIIYGARTSLFIGFSVQVIAFSIGVPLGALAALRGGRFDFVVTRLVEVMTAFPGFLFAIFLMSILGAGIDKVIFAIGITSWIEVCRLTRAQFLALREREFILAARAYGAADRHIFLRHLLPHALPS